MTAPAEAADGLLAAARSGSRLRALRALRDSLAADLDGCESLRDKASLSQRLMDVLVQIDDLGGGTVEQPKETGLSDFEKRLREREAAAKSPRRAKSG